MSARRPVANRFDRACLALMHFLIGSVLVLLATSPHAEDDRIVDRAYFEDKSGQLTIDEVVSQSFTPVGPLLSRGYTDSTHWLRIKVRRPDGGGSADPLILRIRPSYLDDVQLYERTDSPREPWRMRVTGDRHLYAQRELGGVAMGFGIKPSGDETTYYLRLRTTSTSLLAVEVLDAKQFNVRQGWLDVFLSIYLAVMFSILIWVIGYFRASHQRTVALFALHHGLSILLNLAAMGYLSPLATEIAPGLADRLTSLIICVLPFTAVMFQRNFLAVYAPARWGIAVFNLMLLVFPFQLIAMMLGAVRLALEVNAILVLLVAPVSFLVALSSRQEAVPSRRALIGVYGFLTLMMVAAIMPHLGWIKAFELALYTNLVNGMVTAYLLFILLRQRSLQWAAERQQKMIDLTLLQQQLELERLKKEEQSRFMAMLAHEVRTPLSVIRMCLSSLRKEFGPVGKDAEVRLFNMGGAVSDLNMLIEHCLQVDRLDQKQTSTSITPCSLRGLIDPVVAATEDPEGRVRIVYDSQAAESVIVTDPMLFRLVISNLVSNALKYSLPGANVAIAVSVFFAPENDGARAVPELVIEVRNPVANAALPDPARLFERYYRGPLANALSGTGLGLYLVKEIVKILGGLVDYVAQVDDDHYVVIFTVRLPLGKNGEISENPA